MSDRVKNAKRNILFAVLSRVVGILFPFAIRTVMLYVLGSQYLGLDSLFASILNFLNLAELGVGSALVYSMYKPIARNDVEQICALLKLYRNLYRLIGAVILTLGIALIPLLPKLVKGDCPPDVNMYVLYIGYLSNTVLSYWLFGYKRSLLSAHQRSDIDSKCWTLGQTGMYLVQIAALFAFHNYYWYILWLPVFTAVSNLLIARVTDKLYPEYKCRGEVAPKQRKEIQRKVVALFGTKANSIILHAMDNIVISAFLGLTMVGLYGNYFYIMNAITGMVNIAYLSITAGIGNSLEVETVEKNFFDFHVLTFANFWLISFCTVSLLCLYQPFMKIWVHEKNMLDMLVVVLLVIYFYVYQIRRVVITYKDAAGVWWEERYRPYITMIVNLVGNFVLVQFIGIYGVILSTIISMLVSIPIENHTVFKFIFHKTSKSFYLTNLLYVTLTVGLCALSYWVCSFAPDGVLGLVVRGFICLLVPNATIVLLFRNTEEYQHARRLLLRR